MDMEEAAGDVVRAEKKAFAFQIDQLPEPVLHHLFKFLDWDEQKCMRQLCKGMERYIHGDYGIHTSVAARNSNVHLGFRLNPKSECCSLKPIPDGMITQAIQGMEGKVIRTLEMDEIHPDYNPFPFQRLIQYPWKLMRVSLKYVDVGFILTLLGSCGNLSEFCYESGFQRPLAEGIQPVPIPPEGGELIQLVTQLPQPNFQVDKLSSLSLHFGEIDPQFHSDWANVVFLLLALSQMTLGSLNEFRFEFVSFVGGSNLKDRLQILACIGQFLARCPNLKRLGHLSGVVNSGVLPFYLGWEMDHFETTRGPPLPKSVLSCLIKKYGSPSLKEVHVAGSLGFNDRMLQGIRQIMEKAGAAMKKLEDVLMIWRRRYESDLFQHLLCTLPFPSLRKISIHDETGQSFTGGSYDLLLGQIQTQSIQPHYWNRNLKELCVSRTEDTINNAIVEEHGNEPFSLPRMLSQMSSLADIYFEPRKPHTVDNLPGPEMYEPDFRLYEDRVDFEIPDVTFEQVGDVRFQALRVLRLLGVKISTEATARLIKLRNLEKLELHVLPEYRHQLFGIKSEDLLTLMGTLRKLEKIKVTMILFPEDEALKSAQVEILLGLGHLLQMRRGVARYNRRSHRYTIVDTELMSQYKFAFGYGF